MLQRTMLLMLALGSTAFAQQDEATEDGTRIQYKLVTEIEIDGLEIEGQLIGPDGTIVTTRKRAEFAPMIKLRTDFNPEMSSTIEEVK